MDTLGSAWKWVARRWRPFPWASDTFTLVWTALIALVIGLASPFGQWTWPLSLGLIGFTTLAITTRRHDS